MKIMLVIVLSVILLSGCKVSTDTEKTEVTSKEEARRKSIFWQMKEPRVQLDPVEEQEYPMIYHSTKGDSK